MDRRKVLSTAASAGVLAATTSVLGCSRAKFKESPIFDSHCHVIDPRYPIIPNQGYVPPCYTASQYVLESLPLNISSGAVVSASFHGFDQTYLTATLKQLGPAWVGVAQIPFDITDKEVVRLSYAGVKALRFNLYRGQIDSMVEIAALARRVHNIAGWHAEIYADALQLRPHVSQLVKLPQIVIDHLGMTQAGMPVLLDLVDAGAKVKASGFGRVDMDIPSALSCIAERNNCALMFGTDFPSTRARRPFDPSDISVIRDVLSLADAERALWQNAIELYQPRCYSAVSI